MLRPKVLYAATLLILCSGLAAPAAPSTPVPPPPGIRLPDIVIPVQPVFPGMVSKLLADQWYVIDSDVPVLVVASPDGLVTITEEAGPVKLKGKFVGGTKIETKTFKGKQVFTVEAVASGRVELLIFPVGATKSTDIVRQSLDVDTGVPPVGPIVPPTPPVVDTFTKAIQDAYTAEPALDKKVSVAKLASLYRTAATTTVVDPTVKTYGTLFADMKTASVTLLPETAVPAVRKVIGARLNLFMSKANDPIDRTKTASEFIAIATALEGVQ